ncbi:nucleotidyl transferase AbiEii/AbiGii toxin family protein [Aeromicrobium chenweiae]|uniref:nucleotidyl transferase AbiEii/AbiGii toxin family protein n=1 Tax=Aeromicrobium chenweiae TaxID=2079793 RepID=UPI001900672E|nr:nucleotidyl transferase AbiEii/AbiGii toxin family protein [Aeromicrobium chenweiae]
MTGEGLTGFQVTVSRLFFELDESAGYVVAGGAALLASDLITRPTQDLDLFAGSPIVSVAPAKDALLRALHKRGWTATIIHDDPMFCRLSVTGDDEVLVDLALDSPPSSTPELTILGPTLAPLELAGRKMLALFGRAEVRDFADVYRLAERFGKEALLAEAAAADPGFDPVVLVQMMGSLERFDDDEFPMAPDEVPVVRAFFRNWVEELP